MAKKTIRMAHKNPGGHTGRDFAVIELQAMFPDDTIAERWFGGSALADRRLL